MASPTPPSPLPPPFRADSHPRTKAHLLLACAGSVATIKLPLIATALHARHPSTLSIHVLLTSSARKFLPTPLHLPGVDKIWTDPDEWTFPSGTWSRGDPVLHIELRKWADILVIAPISANSMAKITAGMCDNLLTSVVRAWDTSRRVVVAPAMNTAMWTHPLTAAQVGVLEGWEWVRVLRPVEKVLACGDVGAGAMVEWELVVEAVERELGLEGGGVIDRTKSLELGQT